MTRITTITNQKGGVGKTTTAHALATGLTFKGYKVLIVDIDPQANISYTMGADDQQSGIYEALKNDMPTKDAIQHTQHGDILPSSLLLAGADMEFTQTGREYLLREVLEPVKKDYEYIIIDTPPTIGILTINALTVSDDVIIPMGADIYSLHGLAQLNSTIQKVRTYCNQSLKIDGLLLTCFNPRTVLSQELRETINEKAKQIGTKVYKTVIREGIIIKETQTQQKNIYIAAPKSNPAKDYLSFIDEYLKGVESNA